LDNNAYFSPMTNPQVVLQGVSGIPFTNCTFSDARTTKSVYDNVTGIYAIFSSIKVGEQPAILPYWGYKATCSFSGFRQAIHLFGGCNSSQIRNSIFTDNQTAIIAEGAQDFRVDNCQFQIPVPSGYFHGSSIGVFLNNSSLYNIVNNWFSGNNLSYSGIGIFVHNSGESNHFVKNNTFENLCTGILSSGKNSDGKDNASSQGFVFQCNRFENNDKDIWVQTGSHIRFIQSGYHETDATGNTFLSPAYNILNEGNPFKYQHLSLPSHTPSVTPAGKVKTVPTTGDYCCPFYGYAGDNYYTTYCESPYRDLNDLNDKFTEMVVVHGVKSNEYVSYGYNSTPISWADEETQGIVEQLEMHPTMDFTIWIAEQIETIDPNGDTTTVIMYRFPNTNLEQQIVLYYELTNLKQQMDMLCYAALELLASDTEGLDIEQYRTWISRFNTIESDYLLADLHIALGEFAEAEAVLNAMPAKFPEFNGSVSHQNYLAYFAAVQEASLYEEGEGMPSQLQDDLTSYIDHKTEIPSYLADDLPPYFEEYTELGSLLLNHLLRYIAENKGLPPYLVTELENHVAANMILPSYVVNNLTTYFSVAKPIPLPLQNDLRRYFGANASPILSYFETNNELPFPLINELNLYFEEKRGFISELARLSANTDLAAIKAYSFGEMTIPGWTDAYPRVFEAHPDCICSHNGNSSISQNNSGENSTSAGKINEDKIANGKNAEDPFTFSQPDDKKAEITIKPNPSTGQLRITNYELRENTVIEIYDVYGKKHVSHFTFHDSHIEIDISHLANGMYFIKITTDESTTVKKIVKH